MTRFVNSAQHITGQEQNVKTASESDSITLVEQEVLRTQIEKSGEEVSSGTDRVLCMLSHPLAPLA